MAVTNTGIPLFSDFTAGGTQFTINPAEMWLGQFTINTSTANGTAPIQIQPNYAVAGAPISQPPALNLPATQISGSYLGNGPPLYEPPQNAFMFGTVNALPTGGTRLCSHSRLHGQHDRHHADDVGHLLQSQRSGFDDVVHRTVPADRLDERKPEPFVCYCAVCLERARRTLCLYWKHPACCRFIGSYLTKKHGRHHPSRYHSSGWYCRHMVR